MLFKIRTCHLNIMLGVRFFSHFQAFNKLLALATNAAQQKFTSGTWGSMLLSTNSVSKSSATLVLTCSEVIFSNHS